MTAQEQMQLVLLFSLMELDGVATKAAVLRHIQDNEYWYKNDENDEIRSTRPEKNWRNNFAYARLQLVGRECLDKSRPGYWIVKEQGKELFYRLLGKAKNTPASHMPCLMPPFLRKMNQMETNPEETAEQVLLSSVLEMDSPASGAGIILTAGPLPKGDAARRVGGRNIYPRNPAVAARALARAEHRCEIDPAHPTFLKRDRSSNYTEPHHLIPLAKTDDFDVSLDREQNIVSLCSHCHNQIHYGTKEDVRRMIAFLFERRSREIFSMLGRTIGLEEMYAMYGVPQI